MTHTIFLELDFYRTGYRSVKAHQYDKDTRFIEVTCIKDASAYPLNPNTKTCILKLQTPDGRHMLKTQTIQPDGKILIALEESMLLAAGTCRAELNVYELSTKKLLSTMPFDLIVIGSVYDNSIVEDSDEFSLLNDMIFFNKELGDKLEQLETDITDAESKRVESEEIRKENETGRQQNEAAREAKESAREAAEAIRTVNEETRKSNEIGRQNAEKARSDTFDQLQDNVDAELTKIEQVNISPLPGKNSYQIQVTDRNGLISASPNLLHTLQMGTVETGDSDEDPTASITGDFGNQKLNLRLPAGKPFKIQRTYTSISEMNADADNIELYEFVLIHTGSVEDEDTGKLYMKDVSGMSYLTDLSGVQGIQGVKGETGATPNLSIGSVTTGEPGTEASVQISGTKENPLLHLTIPRGEPGTIEDLSPEDIGALPVLTSSPSYNTFEDFWSDANKHGIKTSSHMCAMRFKDTGGWTPSLGWWCAIVGFQNGIGSQWSVTGRILLMSTGLAQGGQHVYYGLVDGGSTTTPEVSVTWYKVYSEIDKPSPTDIGALPLTGGTVNGIIKSDKFEGGRGIFSGKYTSTASQRYQNGGLEIRENDMVENAQSDIAYAPSIGFHWGHKTAATLLYHSDAKFYFRHQDGVSRATVDANLNGTVTGEIVPTGGLVHAGKDSWVAYPSDGTYTTNASSETGYLVIVLPVSWTDTMLKFAVSIFNYEENTAVDYYISGYLYTDGKTWYNCSAVCVGKAGTKAANLTVRFGHDGSKCVVLLGETTSVWNYLQVKVHDVLPGWRNTEYSKWCSGWGVYISATTRPTITRTITNTHVGYGSIAASCIGNAATATNANALGGYPVQKLQGANTIPMRDAQGYTWLNYINSDTGNNENPAVSQIIVTNGSDNFFRKASLSHLKSALKISKIDQSGAATYVVGNLGINKRSPGGGVILEPHNNDDGITIAYSNNGAGVQLCDLKYTYRSFSPYNGSIVSLGQSDMLWACLYARSPTINTSDRTKKREIMPLDSGLIKKFIMGLNPQSFKYIDGTSNRTHYGLIAQDVEELMEDLGMSSLDFAGFIKSPKVKRVKIEEEIEVLNDDGKRQTEMHEREERVEIPGEYEYGLRYEEFISPLIKLVQMQQQEIETLKARLDAIEA